jgi:hypothetical protein
MLSKQAIARLPRIEKGREGKRREGRGFQTNLIQSGECVSEAERSNEVD